MNNAATLSMIGSIFSGSLRKATPEPATTTLPEPPRRVLLGNAPLTFRPAEPRSAVQAAPSTQRPTQPRPRATTEEVLLDILEAPVPAGHTAASGYKLKEEALGVVMAQLSADESRVLYKRLATPVEGDVLAAAFAARLTGERRNRLLVYLADARRRAAIAARR